ncbi:MAG: alpha-amylase family protein [Armatimonadota bacterium]
MKYKIWKRSARCERALLTSIFVGMSALLVFILGTQQAFGMPLSLVSDVDSIAIKARELTLRISLNCPEFVFDGQTVGVGLTPAGVKGKIQSGRSEQVEASFSPIDLGDSKHLEVIVYAKWSPDDAVLRKWARYRVVGANEPVLLKEIIVERLETPGQTPSVNADPVISYPVFMQGFFAGIEFPVAALRSENGRIVLAHRPGIRVQPGKWYETRKAVFGVTEVGQETRGFQQYIANHHPKSNGLHVNYNSWWTSGVPYSEAEIVGLMKTFEDKLYKPYGVHFDSFCIDLGWSDPNTFWDINTKLFPKKFAPLQTAARDMKSSLGLWISPSSHYSPMAIDTEWAKAQGYETFQQPWVGGAMIRLGCLGASNYSGSLKNRLIDIITKFGVQQVKFDGYAAQCPEANHGHETGVYSAEAVADGMISICRAARLAAPHIWLEATCMGWNPSPWWLFEVNSVLAPFGDDAPRGRIPCPIYRESYTTARDYYNLQGAALQAIPIASQEVLGIIHQSPEPFTNDAVTTVMRGHLFLPVYLNPKYMSEERWKTFADIISWARKNADALQQTRPILPASWRNGNVPQFVNDAVMPREPYGYAHPHGNSCLVELRNPWIESCNYSMRLDPTLGILPSATGLSVVSLYPEVRVYGKGLHFGDTLNVPLAPYETLVLSVAAKQSLNAIPSATDTLRGFGQVKVTRCEKARVEFSGLKDASSTGQASPVGDAAKSVRLTVDAQVEALAAHSELLVLVEASTQPATPVGHIRINGVEVQPVVNGSADGWSSTGSPVVEHWVFVRVPLSIGSNAISMELFTGNGSHKVSSWVWAKRPGGSTLYPNALPQPEDISLHSICLVEPFELDKVTSAASDL